MNEYGEKINKLVEVVKSHYSEMEKLKYNDEEVLKLYADFFQDILNNKSQAEYYRGRLRDIQGEGGQEMINSNDPADTTNENIDYIFHIFLIQLKPFLYCSFVPLKKMNNLYVMLLIKKIY